MARAAQRKAPETDRLKRNFSFQPQTIDEDARTFWAVAATETPVATWYGSEILLVSAASIEAAKAVSKIRRPVAANPVRSQVEEIDDQLDEGVDELETRSDGNIRTARFQRQLDDLIASGVRSGLKRDAIEDEMADVRSIDEARKVMLDLMIDRQNQSRTSASLGRERIQEGQADERMIDALAVRLGAKPADMENPLRSMSLVQIGRQALEARGVATRSFDDQAVADIMVGRGGQRWGEGSRAMHTVSDFPLLLQAAGERALLERYRPMVSPLKMLSARRDARDFRTQTFIRPGEAPKLEKLAESAEITRGTLGEEGNSMKLDTYAKMFTLSRQALINDDLGAFADLVIEFARISAVAESELLFGLLSANSFSGATLSDGLPGFHADHGNKSAVGSLITEDSVSAAREAMRLQKNVNKSATIGGVPAVLLVGPKKETEAEKFVASINAATTANVNPFAGKLRVEVENQYTGNGWWLFADPQQRPALMHGYLQGRDGPMIETQDGWGVLGRDFRCVLDFGCAWMDYRAAYFNPGA